MIFDYISIESMKEMISLEMFISIFVSVAHVLFYAVIFDIDLSNYPAHSICLLPSVMPQQTLY